MKLRPVDPSVSFPDLEVARLNVWEAGQIFERSVSERPEDRRFTFYDGPPFATGLPHYGQLRREHHQGHRPALLDYAGLPRRAPLGLGLPRVAGGERGPEEARPGGQARRGRLRDRGFQRGLPRHRVPLHERVGEGHPPPGSLGRLRERLPDDGRGLHGVRVVGLPPAVGEGPDLRGLPRPADLGRPWARRCPTSRSRSVPRRRTPVTKKEGHKRRQDPSITVRFKLEDEDAYLWAWTTTPWTLPSNLALAVHPEVEYGKVRVVETGEVAYVHLGRLADYQERGRVGETELLERLKGEDLVGRPYEPLLPYFREYREKEDGSRWAFKVVAADYVGTDAGTGIVHQAPAFGEDDYTVGQREGAAARQPAGPLGHLRRERVRLRGPVRQGRRQGHRGAPQGGLEARRPGRHRPRGPRTATGRACRCSTWRSRTWFMRVEGMREELVANNDKVHWVPE